MKVAEAIRETVSMAILVELHDPRISDVTVTFVEVSGDLRHAKVHFSVMGDEKKQQLCLAGLRHSAGYLQRKVSDRVELRYTPRLQFVLDQGVKNAMEVTRILREVLPEETADRTAAAAEESIPEDSASQEESATQDSAVRSDHPGDAPPRAVP